MLLQPRDFLSTSIFVVNFEGINSSRPMTNVRGPLNEMVKVVGSCNFIARVWSVFGETK